jgi:glutamate synthase domain-containing protein 2/glutamate synthase domain-containing protein 1/glutamate synthase domain-containing protein 3
MMMGHKNAKALARIENDPGRGGCGILAIADLAGPPSHELVRTALEGLARMEHRGGTLGDTGDGAGIIVVPGRTFFERFIAPGKQIPSAKEPLIVGTVFFLHGERNVPELRREIDLVLRREGLMPLGWRAVPVDPSALGRKSFEDAPVIYQMLVAKGHRREAQLLSALHQVKVLIEGTLPGLVNIVSLAAGTTVYKALATSDQLARFYTDFADQAFTSNIVVGHRRYSTNTFSNWNLVQPFRYIAHNGEINTITANCRAIRDADCALSLGNTLMNHGSDSAQVDRVAEMMAATGVSGIHEALRRMMPPSWIESAPGSEESAFFEANRRALGTLGAWEGPIAIVATDGRYLTAILDRMGLRPLRYMMTAAGRLIISSEVGAVPVPPSEIARDGQLEPGGMIVADIVSGEFIPQEESTSWITTHTGLNFHNLATVDLRPVGETVSVEAMPVKALNAFGWTDERKKHLKEMVRGAKEPLYGMGNDTPLAIFSENHSRLYSFLHQIVAVVTNPPIDPIREGGAIDTTVYLGRSPRISRLSAYESHPQYRLPHPVLTNERLGALLASDEEELRAVRMDATFADTGRSRAMVRRIHELTDEALETIRMGRAAILVLSDREAMHGERLPLPMLLVASAIHQALADAGLRRDVSIVVETGGAHEAHDCAILLAYGATAVNPYAMYSLAEDIAGDEGAARGRLTDAIVFTLRRVMSKMGITTIAGYRGSALFEAVGISSDVVEYYIPDTVSKLGGITMEDIYDDIAARFKNEDDELSRNRNVSVFRREVVEALHRVAQSGNAKGDYDCFVGLLSDTPPVYLRDMLEFQKAASPLPLKDVADVNEIVRSSITGAAMSHGALNGTAHRAIASAFNRFGAKSNCGEGGEDDRRNPGGPWEDDCSKVRQVASGRFGVDARYLVHAEEIEVKIGQGAKPGEGGHLPGGKVTAEVARIRKTREGIDLISPPPHHDIYSIEDLAQLISNLREVNPRAFISVKVPSITGLGTISVGIAKAQADVIVVSGFEGGTGAASSSSITHAGLPVERGVSEAHQYLLVNGIRDRVRLRADGGIKSGLDAAKIMALGADEVSIGTPLLIAERCVFCRGCSKGNCPVGIATHDEEKHARRFMRKHAPWGETPEVGARERYEEARDGVVRYLECVGAHLQRILGALGLRHPSELVGRVDLLRQRSSGNPRWNRLDLSELLLDFRNDTRGAGAAVERSQYDVSRLNALVMEGARSVLRGEAREARIELTLQNADHAVGATLAGEIAAKGGLPEGACVRIDVQGFAGHGFGFAATRGMELHLSGYANDAVAEVMGEGARVIIVPSPAGPRGVTSHLVGNAAAYGASGGVLYVAGRAGQRFGVRNSGATLVCEGAGKYAFEYMTGGVGVVLGCVGPCVGSGMTGGELALYDPDGASRSVLHADVEACAFDEGAMAALLGILTDYADKTGSSCARHIVEGWEVEKDRFIRVRPV